MKLMKLLIISFCIIMMLSTNIFATEEIMDIAGDWLTTGRAHADTTMNTDDLNQGASKVYNLLLAIATAVAIIVGAMLGIQYMTAGIDKKVEVKESLFPYIISCIVVFGSLGIWKLVVTIMAQI